MYTYTHGCIHMQAMRAMGWNGTDADLADEERRLLLAARG
jgi:hypothetical protein